MDQIVNVIAVGVGLPPEALPGILAIIMLLSRTVGRVIPDDTKGLLGIIRKLARIVGVYSGNKLSSGVTTTDAVKAALQAGTKRLDLDDLK